MCLQPRRPQKPPPPENGTKNKVVTPAATLRIKQPEGRVHLEINNFRIFPLLCACNIRPCCGERAPSSSFTVLRNIWSTPSAYIIITPPNKLVRARCRTHKDLFFTLSKLRAVVFYRLRRRPAPALTACPTHGNRADGGIERYITKRCISIYIYEY